MSGARPDGSVAFRPEGSALNFRGVNRVVKGRVGYKGATGEDFAIKYAKEKPGGSDVGHIVDMNNGQYIIKTGITLSLLGQALKKSVEGNADKEKLYLSFIVGNFTRIAGDKPCDHSELLRKLGKIPEEIPSSKDFSKLLTEEMLAALNEFKKTEAGTAILDKLKKKESLNTSDVYSAYLFLVNKSDVLREVAGLSSFSDLINGACGQFFNNVYQERLLPREMLDDHSLLIEQNDNPAMFLASRFNRVAMPFDSFLLKPFLNKQCDDDNVLEACKHELSAQVNNLRGLGSAILLRLLMGESADLGPDNMLLINHDGAQHIMNIDVTGMRYARRNVFNDPKNGARLGWESILTSDNPEEIKKALFDKSVFSNRFVKDAKGMPDNMKDKVMNAILEVMQSKIDASELYKEVLDLRSWLQAQMTDGVVKTLEAAIGEAYDGLHPACKPNRSYVDKLIKHDRSFVQDSIQVAQALLQPAQAAVLQSNSSK